MTLGIRAATAVLAEPGQPYEYRPEERRYLADLLRPFGQKVEEDRLSQGTHVSHSDLFDQLIAGEAAESVTEPDLVLVAYALPDLQPFHSVSSRVMSQLGGAGRNMAVSEQGVAAAFTALQIASAYDRLGQADRTVVLILEQATLPVDDDLVERLRPADAGVLLVLEASAVPALVSVAPVPRSRIADAVAEQVRGATLVVSGAHLDISAAGADVHRSDSIPTYSLGPWFELGRHWSAWAGTYDRLVLAEADPRYPDRSHLAVFDTGRLT